MGITSRAAANSAASKQALGMNMGINARCASRCAAGGHQPRLRMRMARRSAAHQPPRNCSSLCTHRTARAALDVIFARTLSAPPHRHTSLALKRAPPLHNAIARLTTIHFYFPLTTHRTRTATHHAANRRAIGKIGGRGGHSGDGQICLLPAYLAHTALHRNLHTLRALRTLACCAAPAPTRLRCRRRIMPQDARQLHNLMAAAPARA